MRLGYVGLRGHHLVCLQFFEGSGYSEEFVDNLRRVLDGFQHEGAVLEAGPDDVCARCHHLGAEGECTLEPGGEQSIRALDKLAVELLQVDTGQRVDYEQVRAQVARVLRQWRAQACDGCQWATQCEPAQRLMARDTRP